MEIWCSGDIPAKEHRAKLLAARAEAAYFGYASTFTSRLASNVFRVCALKEGLTYEEGKDSCEDKQCSAQNQRLVKILNKMV